MLGVEERSIDGLTAGAAARARSAPRPTGWWPASTKCGTRCQAALAEDGHRRSSATSRSTQRAEAWLDKHFREQIFPVLTPQAIDPAHPVPVHPQQGPQPVVRAEARASAVGARAGHGAGRPCRGSSAFPASAARYIALETLIRRKTDYLFPQISRACAAARSGCIRDSDIEIEEEAEDLVRYFRTAIKRRRRGRVVRLEIEPEHARGADQGRSRTASTRRHAITSEAAACSA